MTSRTALVLIPPVLALFVLLGCVASPRADLRQAEKFEASLRAELSSRRIEGVERNRRRIADLASASDVPAGVAYAVSWLPGKQSGVSSKPSVADMTAALRAAFAAPVDLLVVTDPGFSWSISEPLVIDGPKQILIENGCIISAAEGYFRGTGESLLTVRGPRLKLLSGYGARLSMRGYDYRSYRYESSQWRHGLALFETDGLVVEGLEIRDTGGDGVYVGQKRGKPPCKDLELRDLRLISNHRQGVSVIAADGFLMEWCLATLTRGHLPQAGIDFEPNAGTWGLDRCVVRSCILELNSGAALNVHPTKLGKSGRPVSIRVEASLLAGYPLALWARGMEGGVRGKLEIVDSVMRGVKTIQKTRDFSVELR